jgi:hypothetical protein
MHGFEITVSRSDVEFVLESASFLGNTELINEVLDADGQVDAGNILYRLETKGCGGCDIEDEIDFAALHFYELDLERLKRVDFSILERIVSSPLLRLSTEDSLLDFILDVGCDREVLFRCLHSEHLSSGRMTALLEDLWRAGIDPLIWASLYPRLMASVRERIAIPMPRAESLEGIISYLAQKHGGNVHDMGIVTITSKSVKSSMYPASNVADLPTNSGFVSRNEPGQWICWDFGEMRIRPGHYTIRTNYLKSWAVEASLDGETWTEINRKTANRDFRYGRNAASFAVSKPKGGFGRNVNVFAIVILHVVFDLDLPSSLGLLSIRDSSNERRTDS